MARQATTTEVILEALVVAEASGCSFEQLISACPGFTWNQIFLEVDRLSRDSRVRLNHEQSGAYRIRLPEPSSSSLAAMGRRQLVESDGKVSC